jgi:hypothetical protein
LRIARGSGVSAAFIVFIAIVSFVAPESIHASLYL